MRKTNQKGFTIIELLVVIVIIGILVALALPQLFAAQARGRDTDRKNDLKNLQQKLENYYTDNDSYPSSLPNTEAGIANADLEGPRNTTYTYTAGDCVDTECQSYTLSAALENDKDSAADDDGNYVLTSVNTPEAETTEE